MSVEAMAWAIRQQDVTAATARHVLLVLANFADHEGRNAFPAASTLAKATGLTERGIRLTLAKLQKAGAIKLGNQAIVAAHIDRADRRPVVYDLCITGVNAVHPVRTGGTARPHGVNLTTARGEPRSPKPAFNHPRTNAHAGARAGDKSPGNSQEQSGRQPDAKEVLARSAPDPAKLPTPDQARAHLDEITKSLRSAASR